MNPVDEIIPMRAPLFGFFCLASAIGLAAMTNFAVAFSGWGDGAGGNAISHADALPLYFPSVYLLALFICSFGFIKDTALKKAEIVTYVLLGLSGLILVVTGPFGIVLGLVLGGFALGARRWIFGAANSTKFQTVDTSPEKIALLEKVFAVVDRERGSLSDQDRLVIKALPLTELQRLYEAFTAPKVSADQLRSIEKADVIGKKIAEIIVSLPDKPVTMSDQSFSRGFLRLNTGEIIDLGSYAPPLIVIPEIEVQKVIRDAKYEAEFQPAIGPVITELLFPDETEDGSIHVGTANGFLITFGASCFWIRPCIERRPQ